MKITQEIIVVTPWMAESWLQQKAPNRTLKEWNIQRLTQDLIEGRWFLSTDAIAFDTEGRLVNGQHRLHAIVRSKTPAQLSVMRGLPSANVQVLDTGVQRTAADVLGLVGQAPNSAQASAVIARIITWERTNGTFVGAQSLERTASKADILSRYNAERDRIDRATQLATVVRVPGLPNSLVGLVHYLLQAKGQEASFETFMNLLRSGEGLPHGSPILALSKHLVDNLARRVNETQQSRLAVLIKAYNAWYKGRSMQRIQWDASREAFPKL